MITAVYVYSPFPKRVTKIQGVKGFAIINFALFFFPPLHDPDLAFEDFLCPSDSTLPLTVWTTSSWKPPRQLGEIFRVLPERVSMSHVSTTSPEKQHA